MIEPSCWDIAWYTCILQGLIALKWYGIGIAALAVVVWEFLSYARDSGSTTLDDNIPGDKDRAYKDQTTRPQ